MCEKVKNPAFDGLDTLDGATPMVTFYDVLNGFLHMDNVDVFVTGSNSHMLSSDIATEFRGRGWQIRVHPLTFKEFKEANKNRNLDNMALWKEYHLYGGLPAVSSFLMNHQKERIWNPCLITPISTISSRDTRLGTIHPSGI